MKKIILLIILGFIAIALLGLTISLQQNTLIEWWKPLAVAVIPATILGLSFAEISSRISGWSNRTLNIIVGATFWLIAALGCFYALNFFGSDTDSTIDCHARVINKYTEEHYRPRRISRYTTVRGQKYRVYYINLRLPDGKNKKLEITATQYIKIRKGKSITLKIQNGLLGIPIIKKTVLPELHG